MTGIQHQKAVVLILIDIAETDSILADRLIIAKILVNLPEFLRCGEFCRETLLSLILCRMAVINIMVTGYYQYRNSRVLPKIKLLCQLLMTSLLPVQCQIPAQNQHIRLLADHLLQKSIRDLLYVGHNLAVPMLHHVLKTASAIR